MWLKPLSFKYFFILVYGKSRHSLSRSNIVFGTKETLLDQEVPSVREEAEDTFEDASEDVGGRVLRAPLYKGRGGQYSRIWKRDLLLLITG